jgi:hypothetical protein
MSSEQEELQREALQLIRPCLRTMGVLARDMELVLMELSTHGYELVKRDQS